MSTKTTRFAYLYTVEDTADDSSIEESVSSEETTDSSESSTSESSSSTSSSEASDSEDSDSDESDSEESSVSSSKRSASEAELENEQPSKKQKLEDGDSLYIPTFTAYVENPEYGTHQNCGLAVIPTRSVTAMIVVPNADGLVEPDQQGEWQYRLLLNNGKELKVFSDMSPNKYQDFLFDFSAYHEKYGPDA